MGKRRKLALLCVMAVVLSGSTAMAQSRNALVDAIDAPVKSEGYQGTMPPFVVRSTSHAGTAAFAAVEDLVDNTLWVGDLFSGRVHQYDKQLNLLQSVNVPVMAGTTSTGIAFDPNGDGGAGSFWICNIGTGRFNEVDRSWVATGNSFLSGFAVVGPATIDPAGPASIWFEDIALDMVFQSALPGGTVLDSHVNPDDTGSGAFGNGLSYDAHDSFMNPGNLVISSGPIGAGRVTTLWEGNPSAALPRAYNDVFDVSTLGSFLNGIQDTTDASAPNPEVIYVVDNGTNTIFEISEIPPILQCAPGAVNLGGPTPAFLDDMESGQQPFWNVSSTGFGSNDWAIVNSPSGNARSVPNVWFVVDESTIADKFLDLTMDISAPATTLEFWHTFDMETNFDGGVLELSTNGGTTFFDLGGNDGFPDRILMGGYNGGPISTSFGSPIGGKRAWTSNMLGPMQRVVVDLSDFAGTMGAVVRWRHASDNSVSDYGWEVDDVAFVDPNDPCTAGPRADVVFINREVPATCYMDDIESGQGPEWTVTSTGFGSNDWAIVNSPSGNAHSPPNVWFVVDESTIADKFLDLDLSLAVCDTLEFWHTWDMETNFDGGVLELSTDGGSTYFDLGGNDGFPNRILQGGYNGGPISTSFGSPIGGKRAWTSNMLGPMQQVIVDLSDFAGQNVTVRWRHASDNSVSDYGWEVDDVTLRTLGSPGTGGADFTIDDLTQSTPLSFEVVEAPANVGDGQSSNACIYAFLGAPGPGDVVVVPKNLGTMCFGPPALGGNPRRIFNSLGFVSRLGAHNSPFPPPVIPDGGAVEFAKRPSGTGMPVTATIQGFIEDDCSMGTVPYSVTNGILLRIQ